MDRRDFLKWQAGGMAWLSAGAGLALPGLARAEGAAIGEFPDVVIAKGAPGAAARTAVDALGGMGRFVKAGQKVVIKPNMSFAKGPETATNTHPEVVRELVLMVKEAGAGQVLVLDHSLHNPDDALRLSGILAACEEVAPGVCHHLMDERYYLDAQFPQGKDMKENKVMRDVLEADVLIAAPVAKSHGATGVSLSLKGQMGLIWDRRIMHSLYALSTAIVDMCTLLKPHLAVIDATRVLSSKGPGGPGLVLEPGEIIASADPVAADATAVAAYDWYSQRVKPGNVGHIVEAHNRGLGRMDIENLVTQRVLV